MTHAPTHDSRHDPLLVARHAAGDVDAAELADAAALVAACPECASLHADLRALAAATRDLPAPRRPRDFRLRPEDLGRLRRPAWRRVAAALAGPRFELATPVGAALTSLGLAGLLFAALPAIQLGRPAAPEANVPAASLEMSAPAGQDFGDATSIEGDTAAEPSGEAMPSGAGGAPSGVEPRSATDVPRVAVEPHDDAARVTRDPAATGPAVDVAIAVVAGTLLIVGLGLFGLRWTARRLGDG